jgi:hypothetical protein
MEEINKTPAMERLYPTQHRAARGRDVCGRRQRLPLECGRCVEQGNWKSLFQRRCTSSVYGARRRRRSVQALVASTSALALFETHTWSDAGLQTKAPASQGNITSSATATGW